MSQILVRDLDPDVVKRLKERAKRNHRSLQAEVRLILENAAPPRIDRETFLEIARQIREEAGPQTTDSVELLREGRGPV